MKRRAWRGEEKWIGLDFTWLVNLNAEDAEFAENNDSLNTAPNH